MIHDLVLVLIRDCENIRLSQYAPIAQGIEHRSPEPGAQVRILLGAPDK